MYFTFNFGDQSKLLRAQTIGTLQFLEPANRLHHEKNFRTQKIATTILLDTETDSFPENWGSEIKDNDDHTWRRYTINNTEILQSHPFLPHCFHL